MKFLNFLKYEEILHCNLMTGVSFDALKKTALNTEKNILKAVKLFDVYQGNKLPKGKKSYGVSFYFQDPKRP